MWTFRLIVVVCCRAPDVPVTVTVNVPRAAVLLTRSVNVLDVVAGLGLNDGVTPEGSPETLRLTLLLNPFSRVTVIVVRAPVPRLMLKLLGEAESEKFGGAVTVKETVVVRVRLPEMPVTVTVKVPVVAAAPTVNVRTLLEFAGLVPNAAVTPLGSPEAERVTLLLKPF